MPSRAITPGALSAMRPTSPNVVVSNICAKFSAAFVPACARKTCCVCGLYAMPVVRALSGNAINLFEPAKDTKKRIMSIKTDSTPVADPKNPDTCNVFALYKLMATPDETAALRARYVAGGMGYGDAKTALAEVVERVLGPARERRAQLANDAACVEDALTTAGRKARAVARGVMEDVREACGIVAGIATHR